MDGHRSDLRTGLYRQMVEIHEPVRLVAIVEAPPSRLMAIASRNVRIASLLNGGWFVLYAFEPESRAFHRFRPDGVERISLPEVEIAVARTSAEHAPRGTEPARLAHIGASFVSEVA